MKELRPYLVEFREDETKKNVYSLDWAVDGEKRWLIIVITHDECIFSANNRVKQAWISQNNLYLRPKKREQGIIISRFVFFFGRLDLISLILKIKNKIVTQRGLKNTAAVKVFKYKKIIKDIGTKLDYMSK